MLVCVVIFLCVFGQCVSLQNDEGIRIGSNDGGYIGMVIAISEEIDKYDNFTEDQQQNILREIYVSTCNSSSMQ